MAKAGGWRCSAESGQNPLRPWIPLAALALALAPLGVVRPVRVSGHSMEPALADGVLHWSWRAWVVPAPRRGEVWLVKGPQGASVKRVLGLPGEQVRWEGGDLWINHRRLDEPWVAHPERNGSGQKACGDGYLVLGDNRPASQDGRSWGPLPAEAMIGRLLVGP